MGKDEDKKGINLMPEELRSKESGLLSKMKSSTDFDFDFVSPKDSALKKIDNINDPSALDKIKRFFSKPERFGQTTSGEYKNKEQKQDKEGERPKIIYNPHENKPEISREENTVIQLANKQADIPKQDFKMEAKNNISDDFEDIKISKEISPASQEKSFKPSFWAKIKSFFEAKAPAPKVPKIARVPAKEIISKNSQDIRRANREDEVIDILDRDDIKSIPEIKAQEEVKISAPAKLKGVSFWAKIKSFFEAKAPAPKVPKIARVPAKEIISKNSQDIRRANREDEVIDILDRDDIKSIPEIKAQEEAIPKVQLVDNVSFEQKIPEDRPSTDFSIPAFGEQKNKKQFEEKIPEDKKAITQKFHQPQPRIRAKLLDNGGGVDLIPTSAKTRSWRQVINLLLVACLASIFVLGIFYGFLFYQAKNIEIQNANRATQITSIEKQIVDYKDLNESITELGTEIKLIHKLLSLHFYWTNFFQLLEKYTISDVHYAGLTAGSGGALTLQAVAADFDALARQIKVLQQQKALEFVVAVDVASAKYNDAAGNVEFNMTIVLNPSLFVYNENYIYEIENSSSTAEGTE